MCNERKITVKGIGNLKLPVDWVKISFSLNSVDLDYNVGYEAFAKRISNLQDAVASVGFKKDDLKSSVIRVRPNYRTIKRKSKGEEEYKQLFAGYSFESMLVLSISFDSKKLGDVLNAIAASETDPNFDIQFTVKDGEGAKNMLLAAAAKDAKTKAEILCSAAGAKLGKLYSISYNWEEINIYSRTKYDMNTICDCVCENSPTVELSPEDVEVEDSATFVWDIV